MKNKNRKQRLMIKYAAIIMMLNPCNNRLLKNYGK
jgi:hypothetical protein